MTAEDLICQLTIRHWDSLRPGEPVPKTLVPLKVLGKTSANANIVCLVLDGIRRRPVAVAKIPRNPCQTAGVEREHDAMVHLRGGAKNSDILTSTTCRGVLVDAGETKILLQDAAAGKALVSGMTSDSRTKKLYDRVLPWMYAFHLDTAETCVLEGESLRTLVEAPITRFFKEFAALSTEVLSPEACDHLHRLPGVAAGRTVSLCAQHGDFNAHNVLVDDSARTGTGFSVIDWEDFRPRQLPVHDLNHFFTSNSYLLGAGAPPEESYSRFVLSEGWYRELFVGAIGRYQSLGIVDSETFSLLTPLYFVGQCLRMTEVQREQQHTASVWMKRMNCFVKSLLSPIP